jgi:hypothetical protein
MGTPPLASATRKLNSACSHAFPHAIPAGDGWNSHPRHHVDPRKVVAKNRQEAAVNEPVERKITETGIEARQGTGPRAMVSVLAVSLFIAAVAGSALLAYFFSA